MAGAGGAPPGPGSRRGPAATLASLRLMGSGWQAFLGLSALKPPSWRFDPSRAGSLGHDADGPRHGGRPAEPCIGDAGWGGPPSLASRYLDEEPRRALHRGSLDGEPLRVPHRGCLVGEPRQNPCIGVPTSGRYAIPSSGTQAPVVSMTRIPIPPGERKAGPGRCTPGSCSIGALAEWPGATGVNWPGGPVEG